MPYTSRFVHKPDYSENFRKPPSETMSSFVPEQDEGVVAPVLTGTAFGQTLKNQPVPWPTIVMMFKTTRTPKVAAPIIPSTPLIAANTTLEQDKATMLR